MPGLPFQPENPFGGAANVMSQAGQSFGAMGKSQTVTTEEEMSTEDILGLATDVVGAGAAVAGSIKADSVKKDAALRVQKNDQRIAEFKALKNAENLNYTGDETMKKYGTQPVPKKMTFQDDLRILLGL